MPGSKKDSVDFRSGGGNSGRVQNGNRSGFRTDTAISNNRRTDERTLKRWGDGGGETLEESSSGPWDQFAANERLFGLKTDYDENMYTTAIDKSHPQYKERMAAAERKAREIERTAPVTSHVAEERVMDFVPGNERNGDDEEEKYSGVRRQDAPHPLTRETKYTPPAKRAPSAQATVMGAPVDPAIISSQLRVTHPKKAVSAKSEEIKAHAAADKAPASRSEQSKSETKQKTERVSEGKAEDAKPSAMKSVDAKPQEKTTTPLRSPAVTGARGSTPQTGDTTPNASATVERDVLNSFKIFAATQRSNLENVHMVKTRANKEVKLTELKKFANTFKLSTPVPSDLIGIIAKDPARQKEIQAKALQNAEDVQRAKEEAAKAKDSPAAPKESQPKGTGDASTPAASEQKPAPRPQPSHTSSHTSMPNRHGGGRQSYGPSGYSGQQYSRNDRSGQQQQQGRPTGNLAQRLRNVEQHKASQPPHAPGHVDARLPPTAPANSGDSSFNRRPSGAPGHSNKLNPNIQEFRPNAFAPAFNPVGHPSTASSPRSAATNHGPDMHSAAPARQLTRRKTKAIDVKAFDIIASIKAIKPPPGRGWEENCGLRPTYDTQPTWRQLQEDSEKPESTMYLTYKQYFERNPFSTNVGAAATPNPPHAVPQLAHQHQLPFHLQHGQHSMAPRPSPHMAPMQMHAPPHAHTPHAHTPHVSYANTDDHRMMHSNSAQSFASPRMAPAAVNYPPAQVPYGQPMMQPFVPNAPHMGQYRSFSNNPQYMPQQPGPMGAPMMMQPQFVTGPQGMMATPPQMQMYPTAQGQFVPPGAVSGPPQTMPNSNGYPSPGRPTAPPMAHQGSAQGQPTYGMSPGMSYQQPAFGSQTPGQMNATRGYGSPAMPHYGSSPSNFQQYGPQRTGGNNFNKNFASHGQQHHLGQPSHGISSGSQGRASEGADEAK